MSPVNLPTTSSPADLRYGKDPLLDAWLIHFMSENHIEYSIDPTRNASPEQIRFMVHLGPDENYVPCSDEMLRSLLEKTQEPALLEAYAKVWRQVMDLIETHCSNQYDKMMILALCDHKYRQAVNAPVMIPSRLLKRLTTIFLAQSGQDDPYRERRRTLNRRARQFMDTLSMQTALNACPGFVASCGSIQDLRFELDMLEISRLLALSVWTDIWEKDQFEPGIEEVEKHMLAAGSFDDLRRVLNPNRPKSMKILYMPENAGGLMFDIRVVKVLISMGHRVILALKEGFYFDAPTVWDAEEDPVLSQSLAEARFWSGNQMTKNALLQAIKENSLLVISDGSRERLNLYKVSVTFARAWKECDLVIAKGVLNHRRLMLTRTEFTRDVLCVHQDDQGALKVQAKMKPATLRVFTEPEITAKAEAIISRMRSERAAGKTIMFYSAIVGSVPHETETAIAILTAFVKHLRSRLAGTYVINPAEHFEEGLDADDLMFMWEKVQRSGLINVWRFQTYEDIEQAFVLMGRPVPPVWAGKDATFSTGCTKEMHIALDMQRTHPEMQIIGPNPEKFFRRREYGVGKFFDSAIAAR
ncbi:ARMT1-like domain-containing protein [Fundidesulfovibrio agrisoli]|uniref:ARMT1-like domain-containing protein n=1 Tax=Fundidesulfovibrio agrisoli TaxID=2922717 RepID=UPI001FAB6F63|nr:ARMT1-like domain-containing protein [Fundidesulfovibrio agrisoli]